MTGPIDTAAMRKQAKRTAKDLDAQMCFEDEDTLGATLSAAMDVAKDVTLLCDALDAARAALRLACDGLRFPNDNIQRNALAAVREALGEEKQR